MSNSRSNRGGNNNKKLNQDIERIINNIKMSKDKTLKQILLPSKYALPVQANGDTGWAKLVADNLQDKAGTGSAINSNQLRKFFAEIKSIEQQMDETKFDQKTMDRIWLLVPQIAYAYNRKVIKEDFYKLMIALISDTKIKDKEDFMSLVKFYESIIAYFKKK